MNIAAVPDMVWDPLDFVLPPDLEATQPPEERAAGAGRDDVLLMVARRSSGTVEHRRFIDLPELLRPGDLLVVNTSRTIAAALPGRVCPIPAALHLSTRADDGRWSVELRHAGVEGGESAPWLDASPGTVVELPAGGRAVLERPATAARPGEVRLWIADLELPVSISAYLAEHGRPIRYGYVDQDRPLSAYQTVFAEEPASCAEAAGIGSAEMPSAGRPFSAGLVARLVSLGVGVTPIVLHCGVASLEAHEPPQAERFRVPFETAARVNATRRLGGRVIAVGTTVVRALETAASAHGVVLPADGWTDLVIGPECPIRAVDGMITGWHEPRASHLMMLEAVCGRELLRESYRAALEEGYLWHEFGDSHLILP